MLTVISPAKTLDYSHSQTIKTSTMPELLSHSEQLMQYCKKLSTNDIAQLMKISPNLAELNFQRFQQWQPDFDFQHARQAILAFKGDVYEGLHVEDFTETDFSFAQQHLRILSGLYGVLRPLDLMLPYRLEMGIKLKNSNNNNNLYQFWANTITDTINAQLLQSQSSTLINLASNEYFKSVNRKKLNATIVEPVFLDESKGQYKVISFYAKKARGLMSRYIIKNQLNNIDDLRSFNVNGYQIDQINSTDSQWFFKRSEQQANKHKQA